MANMAAIEPEPHVRSSGQSISYSANHVQGHRNTPEPHHAGTKVPVLPLMCHPSVKLHRDKASSHTSKSTVNFLKEMEQKTGIKAIPFTDIPSKSPDVSPMDFWAFGLLKTALSKRCPKTLTGLWKAVREEWDRIPLLTLQKALLS
ncbi:hypothetical protein X975_13415, partial [Stegodyphus mimosarum]